MKLLIISGFTILYIVNINGFDTNWWRHNILYEIYMSTFKDSNGDGIGDIAGITSKLDHFVDLGIDTLWTTPYLYSQKEDNGYDIENYTVIDPIYGNLNDFDNMIREMKKRGLKFVMDLVINHCSSKHQWFQKSIDRIKPYDDYFVWKDPKGYDSEGNPIPPNNWRSIFVGRAWHWNDKRKQFYYHEFAPIQPDLNLRNPNVRKEIKEILKFWLDHGVSGFRMDAAQFYFEDPELRDEPPINPRFKFDDPELNWNKFQHVYTSDVQETYEFIHELRTFVDEYSRQHGEYERILVPEAYTTLNHTMAYYGTDNYKIVHYPFNFAIIINPDPLTAKTINRIIWRWMKNMPKGAVANWVTENHDRRRLSTKYSKEHADIITIIIMMLPGVACVYYGQELGMTEGPVRWDQVKDVVGAGELDYYLPRDFERTPMQWDDTMNAGFTSNSIPMIPVNPDYWKVNVETQKTQPNSYYNLFKNLSRLKKTDICKHGDLHTHIVSKWVYAFSRKLEDHTGYYVIVNLGGEFEMINLSDFFEDIPPVLYVEVGTINSGFKRGNVIKAFSEFPELFILKPFSGLVLSTEMDDAE